MKNIKNCLTIDIRNKSHLKITEKIYRDIRISLWLCLYSIIADIIIDDILFDMH